MSLSPIFVPSKGRPKSLLLAMLRDEKLPHRVFVEPQELHDYKEHCDGTIAMLTEDNKGLAYVRNTILNFAREQQLESFWMIDDDVTAFHKGDSGGYRTGTAREVLSEADVLLEGYAQGALEYSQFAWAGQPGDHSDGGYCDVCVRIEVPRVGGLCYRDEVNLKEDRDFTLQVLARGERTRRISNLGFSCPANGSNKGGLYEVYKAGKEKEAAEALARLWPHCVTVQKKKNGRLDAKVEWRDVRQNRMFI